VQFFAPFAGGPLEILSPRPRPWTSACLSLLFLVGGRLLLIVIHLAFLLPIPLVERFLARRSNINFYIESFFFYRLSTDFSAHLKISLPSVFFWDFFIFVACDGSRFIPFPSIFRLNCQLSDFRNTMPRQKQNFTRTKPRDWNDTWGTGIELAGIGWIGWVPIVAYNLRWENPGEGVSVSHGCV